MSIDYRSIATGILSAPTPPAATQKCKVHKSLDFDAEPAEGEDEYRPGFYAPGTFVSHLASEREVERGEYNVLLYKPELNAPSWVCSPSFLLATNGFHPQSAPVRVSYLIHTYRLILAVEEVLGNGDENIVAIYDCGEDSGVEITHKCIRFYKTRSDIVIPRLPSKAYPLPVEFSLDTVAEELSDAFKPILRDRVPQSPPYNLYITRSHITIVERKAGTQGVIEAFGPGLWDGARLMGLGDD